jgi:hypothetical protein
MQSFEDNTGISLQPRSYQMFEWDYESWVEQGAKAEFENFLSSVSSNNLS